MKNYKELLFDFIKKNHFILLVLTLYVLASYFFQFIICPIKLICGYPCPGCGMTRAIVSIFKLDFIQAFNYNPFVFVLPFIGWIIVFKNKHIEGKIYNCKILWCILIVLIAIYYLYRIVFQPDFLNDYFENNLITYILNLLKFI